MAFGHCIPLSNAMTKFFVIYSPKLCEMRVTNFQEYTPPLFCSYLRRMVKNK